MADDWTTVNQNKQDIIGPALAAQFAKVAGMNPVLWMLVGVTVVTVGLFCLSDARAAKGQRMTGRCKKNRPLLRDVELSILSEVEPIALFPDVVSIDRFCRPAPRPKRRCFWCRRNRSSSAAGVLAVLSGPDFLPTCGSCQALSAMFQPLGIRAKGSPRPACVVSREAFSDQSAVSVSGSFASSAGDPIRIELRPGPHADRARSL